jgi:hypothetical protein
MGYYSGSYSGTTLRDVFSAAGSNPVTVWDTTGLATSTTNRAGIVNGTPAITQLTSMAPGVLGRNLTAGTPPALTNGAIVFSDSVDDKFEQTSTNTDFDFLYANGTTANIKHSVFFVANLTDNAATGWIFGNNGAFDNNTGYSLGFDFGGANVNLLQWMFNTAGGGGAANYVCVASLSCLVAGAYHVYGIRTDMALTTANMVKAWRGSTAFTTTATANISAAASGTTVRMTLGDAATFGGQDMAGSVKLFATVNGSLTDAQMVNIIGKLGQYTRTPV